MGVFNESVGMFLGPIKEYLDDDSVSEILINGCQEVFVERRGVLERTSVRFIDEQALQAAVRNIAQFVGRKIDNENPILDARLPDGSRVSAVFPPCSRKGTTLAIRKFQKGTAALLDLVNNGSISKDAARFLDICIFLSKNLIVSGGTGTGKTTVLNALGSRIPKTQRLLIIEDSSELKIQTDHVVFFETKHADIHGKGEINVRELVRAALRLRPDRIIVGEVRGPEALDLITAMNTGHGGSMGTTHANSPYDTLVRLETLAMMGETQVPVVALRRQIASAIHIVVHIKRMRDGTRRVADISEILPEVDEHGGYQIQDIYKYIHRGLSPDGKIVGELIPTGSIPTFMNEIELYKLPFTREKFTCPQWYVESRQQSIRQVA